MEINPYDEISRICEKFGFPEPKQNELYDSAVLKVYKAMTHMEQKLDEVEKNLAEEKAIRGCL